MKRIALLIALAVVSLSVMLFIMGMTAVYVVASAVFLTALVVFTFRRKIKNALTVSAALLVVAAFGVYLCLFQTLNVYKTEELVGKSGTITCYVSEEPEYKGDYAVVRVKTSSDKTKNENLCGSINLILYPSIDDEVAFAKVGDEITAKVKFCKLKKNSERYYYADKIFVSVICESATVTGHKYTLYETAVDIRQAVRQRINQNFSGDSRAMLNGIILGDDSAMSNELYNAFKACGILHITAVSGMHIGVLCSAIITVFMLFMKRRSAYLAALFPILLVVAVTGFCPSGVRAGLMCAIAFISYVFLKKSDGLNSLGIAVVIMLFINPFYVCDLGFGLSCLATAGVIVATKIYNDLVAPRIIIRKKWLKQLVEMMLMVFLQSIGAAIFTLPLQILEFGFASLIVPVSSVFVSSAVVYILIITVVGMIVSFIPFLGAASSVIFLIPKLLLKFIEIVTLYLAKIPFSYVPFGSFWAILWIGLSLLFIGVWYLVGKYGGKKVLSVAVAGLFVVSLLASSLSSRGFVEISSINLEKGYCVVIYSGEKCVIIGSGSDKSDAYNILANLRLRGVKTVDAVLLPNESENVAGGLNTLCNNLSLEQPSVTKTEGEVYETLENVEISAYPTEDGCYYKVTVFDKTVIIGAGSFVCESAFNVLFCTRALPQIESAEVTVISGGELNSDLSSYGEVYYNSYGDISLKFAKGKEVAVYGKQNDRVYN